MMRVLIARQGFSKTHCIYADAKATKSQSQKNAGSA
jgi:hypothetical protein